MNPKNLSAILFTILVSFSITSKAVVYGELEVDGIKYSTETRGPNTITLYEGDTSTTLQIDYEKREVEIVIQSPDGISVMQRKIPDRLPTSSELAQMQKFIEEKNILYNGRRIPVPLDRLLDLSKTETQYDWFESMAFANSIGTGVIDILGIKNAYAGQSECEAACAAEFAAFNVSAGIVWAVCGFILNYLNPPGWLGCLGALGGNYVASLFLASCMEASPACKYEVAR